MCVRLRAYDMVIGRQLLESQSSLPLMDFRDQTQAVRFVGQTPLLARPSHGSFAEHLWLCVLWEDLDFCK